MSAKNAYHNFLLMLYGGRGFLVNRGQFSGSHFIDEKNTYELAADSSVPFLKRSFFYGSSKLGLFDFHLYLNELFGVQLQNRENLALVLPLKVLSEGTRSRLKRRLQEFGLNTQMTALSISNDSTIEKIAISDLRPFPKILRDTLSANGIPAIRFKENNEADYFIDLDYFIQKMLEAA